MKAIKTQLLILGFLFLTFPIYSQTPTGSLIFRVLNYKSDVKIKKNIAKQFEHCGIEWSIIDRMLVIPNVNIKYVNLPKLNITRLGQEEKNEVPSGNYSITYIGMGFKKLLGNPQKILSKNAYFNLNELYFNVLPNKTTEIIITPKIQRSIKWFPGLAIYFPDIYVKIIENGKEISEYQLSLKTEKSIPWDNYTGPLKF